MIANTIDEDRVLACGGTNIFGQPKRDCWILGFRGRTPFWSPGPDMLTARDSAAWAVEGDYLFIMGGSLGKLKGSTDSVEMFQVSTGRWVEGPSMSSHRHGHCAVGLGNGSLQLPHETSPEHSDSCFRDVSLFGVTQSFRHLVHW